MGFGKGGQSVDVGAGRLDFSNVCPSAEGGTDDLLAVSFFRRWRLAFGVAWASSNQ